MKSGRSTRSSTGAIFPAGAQPDDRFASEFSTDGAWDFNYLQMGNYGDTGLFGLGRITLFDKLTVLKAFATTTTLRTSSVRITTKV